MKTRPLLVICVDRDNDLFEKAKVMGPLIGREKNLDGATKLALADPEDPDSNAIFYAIKLAEQMKKDGTEVEVVTLTGDKELGYVADKKISAQLDMITRELSPTSCVLVSDGAADEEILPIIDSRLKIDSTKIVFIKQAKELEKTYFVLLEKLRDPHYTKIFIGIPALLILLASVASYLGMGWQPVGIVVGSFLILKAFGIDSLIGRVLKDFSFSVERMSWIAYICGYSLLLVAALIGYQTFYDGVSKGIGNVKLIAYVLSSMVWIVLIAVLVVVIGKSADALSDKQKYSITRYSVYAIGATLSAMVLKVGSDWVLNINSPYVSFGDFLTTLICALVLGYASTRLISFIKKDILLNMKLDGKEAVSDTGTYLGKIAGVDGSKGNIIIQTLFEKKYVMPFSAVTAIGENVVLKTGE
jgi:putative membrane protein